MTTDSGNKIKLLLNNHVPGTLLLAPWLETLGISRDLQAFYRKSGWLVAVARGAYARPNDDVHWEGAVFALQSQLKLAVHVGALTALAKLGHAHYLRGDNERVFLFSGAQTNLPAWMLKTDWGQPLEYIRTSMLPDGIGFEKHEERTFEIGISTPERAIMECLYLTPDNLDLLECYQIMEGLANLRPKHVQALLEKCRSIKVKRLFLYLAEKAGHTWLSFVDASQVKLGSGDRKIGVGGTYIGKYGLSIPKTLAEL